MKRFSFLAFAFSAAIFALGGASSFAQAQSGPQTPFKGETTQDYNKRLEELRQLAGAQLFSASPNEYRIGPDDLVEISVFEAPEMNRSVRVSAGGEVSMPLLGAVHASGLTPRELESVLQELLRRTYMKDPHVSVFVREMESHPISVVGAVKKPGVFQVRGGKTLLEVLSMAEGLDDDAGDTVFVMRGASYRDEPRENLASQEGALGQETPAEVSSPSSTTPDQNTVEVNLKELLESGDPRHNVVVYPGDIVKVNRAGIVYVVGDVKKPGGFVLRTNENISVLQAIALAEGLDRTASKGQTRVIRTDPRTGERTEIVLNLGRILKGQAPDPILQSKDILFIPHSGAKGAMYRGVEAAVSIVSGVLIFRR